MADRTQYLRAEGKRSRGTRPPRPKTRRTLKSSRNPLTTDLLRNPLTTRDPCRRSRTLCRGGPLPQSLRIKHRQGGRPSQDSGCPLSAGAAVDLICLSKGGHGHPADRPRQNRATKDPSRRESQATRDQSKRENQVIKVPSRRESQATKAGPRQRSRVTTGRVPTTREAPATCSRVSCLRSKDSSRRRPVARSAAASPSTS